MGRLLITLGLGIVTSIILSVAAFIVMLGAGFILGSLNLTATGFLAHLIVSLFTLLLVATPFSLITSMKVHNLFKEKNLKSFGALGNPFVAGLLSWICLNVLVLPYYFLARNDSSVMQVNNEGSFDSKSFIKGCVVGFILDTIFGVILSLGY